LESRQSKREKSGKSESGKSETVVRLTDRGEKRKIIEFFVILIDF